MTSVAIIKCDDYDDNKVYNAVKRGVDLLGGPKAFVKKNEKILLKPNILIGDKPEKCTTTHPAVLLAVGRLFKDAGAILSFGDSPGFGSYKSAAKRSALSEAADKIGITLGDFEKGEEVATGMEGVSKSFLIAQAVRESDGVISLPKLKTHGFQRFTGCVKNQFGCIPGLKKAEYHVKLPNTNDFAKMLVDLNTYINPRLYIMDGIYSMEGNGPRGGTGRNSKILLFSSDPIALDATVCRMMDIDPEFVPTIKYGANAGAGTYDENEIELVGDDFAQFIDKDFDIKREPLKPFTGNPNILAFFKNILVPKPVIINKSCIKCGVCVNICPVKPKALTWKTKSKDMPPVYNYHKCIRCFCCQELCPEKAIYLRDPFIRRLFSRKK